METHVTQKRDFRLRRLKTIGFSIFGDDFWCFHLSTQWFVQIITKFQLNFNWKCRDIHYHQNFSHLWVKRKWTIRWPKILSALYKLLNDELSRKKKLIEMKRAKISINSNAQKFNFKFNFDLNISRLIISFNLIEINSTLQEKRIKNV